MLGDIILALLEFIPKPFPSWFLGEELKWEPPIAKPNDGNSYIWDEIDQEWKIMLENVALIETTQ